MQRRERNFTRADEEQLAVVDVVHLGAVGREEAGFFHRAFAHERGGDNGNEAVLHDRAHRVVDERELEQRGLAHDVRETRSTRFRGAHRVDEAHRLRERGVVEGGRGVFGAHGLDRHAIVFAAVRHVGRGGIGHLQRELAEQHLRGSERFLVVLELGLHRGRALDLRLALVGRGFADLLRCLVLLGALRFRVLAQTRLGVVRREHLVDQARAHALALHAEPVVGLVAQPLQVDHSSPSRICTRRPSTHADAFFHALPTALRFATPASTGPPTG